MVKYKNKVYSFMKKLFFSSFFTILSACGPQLEKLADQPVGDIIGHNIADSLGLGSGEEPERFYDPQLVRFVYEFVANAKEHGVIILPATLDRLKQIKYVPKLSVGAGEGVIAACNRYYIEVSTVGGSKQVKYLIIEVQTPAVQDFTEGSLIRLRELMFHELFHCLLNKKHLPDDVAGIMSAKLTKGSTRAFTEWDQLVEELFSPKFISLIPNAE